MLERCLLFAGLEKKEVFCVKVTSSTARTVRVDKVICEFGCDARLKAC